MSAFNKAFEGVTIVDDTVTVHGKSEKSAPNDEIYVTLMRPHGGPALMTEVVHGKAALKWPAEFPAAAPPFAVGDDVFVVGVAVGPAPAKPFVWKDSFQIEEG
jgi:hypothetical protein